MRIFIIVMLVGIMLAGCSEREYNYSQEPLHGCSYADEMHKHVLTSSTAADEAQREHYSMGWELTNVTTDAQANRKANTWTLTFECKYPEENLSWSSGR